MTERRIGDYIRVELDELRADNERLRKVAVAAAEFRRKPTVQAAANRLDDALCDLEDKYGTDYWDKQIMDMKC